MSYRGRREKKLTKTILSVATPDSNNCSYYYGFSVTFKFQRQALHNTVYQPEDHGCTMIWWVGSGRVGSSEADR